jgi:hypothetical protein
MTRGHMKRWRGDAPKPRVPVLFTEEDLRGLEVSGLT